MRPQAIVIIAGLFLLAGALLYFGPSGYEKLDDMQSLQAQTVAIRETFPELEHISPLTLSLLIDGEADVFIVDARSREEFDTSHIAGALNIQELEGFQRFLGPLEPHQSPYRFPPDLIVIYGSIGKRSAELAEELRLAGHPEVRNLAGSIFQWANEGRPLVDAGGDPATKVLSAARYQTLLLDPGRRAGIE